jgi:aspartyl protease family protein
MRHILIFAAIMIVAGTYMAQQADRMTTAQARPAQALAAAQLSAQPDGRSVSVSNRTVVIPRDGRGHFQADARIEGQRLSFMIDTGASVIALNESAAARIGLYPRPGDYQATVSTANGKIRAAPVRLASVDVGGLVVHDVAAMVLPDEALSENLLGMSYLSRLKRFELANGEMVLQ